LEDREATTFDKKRKLQEARVKNHQEASDKVDDHCQHFNPFYYPLVNIQTTIENHHFE